MKKKKLNLNKVTIARLGIQLNLAEIQRVKGVNILTTSIRIVKVMFSEYYGNCGGSDICTDPPLTAVGCPDTTQGGDCWSNIPQVTC